MRLAIFGLTVTSSWANGHATTWRGLLRALTEAGHHTVFFERDVPYYAAERDLPAPPYCELVLYPDWESVLPRARREVRECDASIVTSYCADGVRAGDLVLEEGTGVRVFYDIDTPITLRDLDAHGHAAHTGSRFLERRQIPGYDLYLSFTGGPSLALLEAAYGARRAEPLYCSVDPDLHRRPDRVAPRLALSYLGTYAPDRQPPLERLLVEPARRRADLPFAVVGSGYPRETAWPPNVERLEHLAPAGHATLYASSRLTLNLTRSAMLERGWSPSVRIFEAAACGAPVLTDRWPGLEAFFEPGREVLVADGPDDVLAALELPGPELEAIASAAHRRTLAEHSAAVRAAELVGLLESAASRAA